MILPFLDLPRGSRPTLKKSAKMRRGRCCARSVKQKQKSARRKRWSSEPQYVRNGYTSAHARVEHCRCVNGCAKRRPYVHQRHQRYMNGRQGWLRLCSDNVFTDAGRPRSNRDFLKKQGRKKMRTF